MSTNIADFDLRSFGMASFDVASTRRPVARVAAAKVKAAAKPVTKAKEPEVTLAPVATAAEVEGLQMELAALRAEIQAIKAAPELEERRQNLQNLVAADFAWRRRMPGA